MWVENCSEELWIGVKGQSNLEIAGSPETYLGTASGRPTVGGRALDGLGPLAGYHPQPNSECRPIVPGRQRAGDNVRTREGKSPDPRLRSPSAG